MTVTNYERDAYFRILYKFTYNIKANRSNFDQYLTDPTMLYVSKQHEICYNKLTRCPLSGYLCQYVDYASQSHIRIKLDTSSSVTEFLDGCKYNVDINKAITLTSHNVNMYSLVRPYEITYTDTIKVVLTHRQAGLAICQLYKINRILFTELAYRFMRGDDTVDHRNQMYTSKCTLQERYPITKLVLNDYTRIKDVILRLNYTLKGGQPLLNRGYVASYDIKYYDIIVKNDPECLVIGSQVFSKTDDHYENSKPVYNVWPKIVKESIDRLPTATYIQKRDAKYIYYIQSDRFYLNTGLCNQVTLEETGKHDVILVMDVDEHTHDYIMLFKLYYAYQQCFGNFEFSITVTPIGIDVRVYDNNSSKRYTYSYVNPPVD